VNGRTPRPQSFCALCCESIGETYLRGLTTRLSYCDHKCYAGHCNPKACKGVMITTDALKYLPQMGLDPRGWSAVRGHVRTRSHWRMDLPSKQSVGEKFSIAFFYSAGGARASRHNYYSHPGASRRPSPQGGGVAASSPLGLIPQDIVNSSSGGFSLLDA